MPAEATTMGENRFHLNNCGLWHFPLKWLLVGWGSGRWRICWGNTQQESLQLGLQYDQAEVHTRSCTKAHLLRANAPYDAKAWVFPKPNSYSVAHSFDFCPLFITFPAATCLCGLGLFFACFGTAPCSPKAEHVI